MVLSSWMFSGEIGLGIYSFKEYAPNIDILVTSAALGTAATWNPTLVRILRRALSIFSSNRVAESVGGIVFGISRTVVNPPAAAAAVPEVKSSLYERSRSRRWSCASL